MRFVCFYLPALLLAFTCESIAMKPCEVYDNLYDNFEKDMPASLVTCATYASRGGFANAATELYNFNETFKNLFSSDFTKIDSKKSIEESLKIYCESITYNYTHSEQYSRNYLVEDFIWYSLCGRLYFSYEGMISQIAYNYESIVKRNSEVVAKKRILPIVQLLYEKLNHVSYQTFSDFCRQMLPNLHFD